MSLDPGLTPFGPTGLPQHRELLQAVEKGDKEKENKIKSQLKRIDVPRGVSWSDQAAVTGLKIIDLDTVLSKLEASKEAVEDYFIVEDEKGMKVFEKKSALEVATQLFKGRNFKTKDEMNDGVKDLCRAITDTVRANYTHMEIGNEVVESVDEMQDAALVRQELENLFPIQKKSDKAEKPPKIKPEQKTMLDALKNLFVDNTKTKSTAKVTSSETEKESKSTQANLQPTNDKATSPEKSEKLTDPENLYLSKLTEEFNVKKFKDAYIRSFDPSGVISSGEKGMEFRIQVDSACQINKKEFEKNRDKEVIELAKKLDPVTIHRLQEAAEIKKIQRELKKIPFGEKRIELLKNYYNKLSAYTGLLVDNRPIKFAQHMGVIYNPKREGMCIDLIKQQIVEELKAARKQKIANLDFELVTFLENIASEKLQKEMSSKEVLDKVGYPQDNILRFANMKLNRDKEISKINDMPIIGKTEGGRAQLERMGSSFDKKIAELLRKTALDPKLVDLKNKILKDKALPTKGIIFSRKETDVVFEIRAILSDLLLRAAYLNDQQAFLEADSIIKDMRASTKGDAKFLDIVNKEDFSTITSAQATVANLQRLAITTMDKNINNLSESYSKTPLSADAMTIKEEMLKSGILADKKDKKNEIIAILMNSLAQALYIPPATRPRPDEIFEKSIEAEKLLNLLHTPQGFPIFADIVGDPQLSKMLAAFETRKSEDAKKIAQRVLDIKLTPQQEVVKKDISNKNIFFGIPKADFTKVVTNLIAESLLFNKKENEKEIDRIISLLTTKENFATLMGLEESLDYKVLRQIYDARKKQGVTK